MKISRRAFVQGLAAVGAAVAALRLPGMGAAVPRIVGDGINNDAPGISALLEGQPVEIVDGAASVTEGEGGVRVVQLAARVFRLDAAIVADRGSIAIANDCQFVVKPGVPVVTATRGSCVSFGNSKIVDQEDPARGA